MCKGGEPDEAHMFVVAQVEMLEVGQVCGGCQALDIFVGKPGVGEIEMLIIRRVEVLYSPHNPNATTERSLQE